MRKLRLETSSAYFVPLYIRIGEIKLLSQIPFQVIIPPPSMYWRTLGGGHFLQAETSSAGVTWALGYDSRPWAHTGGWGGAHFKGVASSKFGVGPVEDAKYFYVYENQRWNPLTGFTVRGLPTDRPSWSDRSGKVAMAKETVRLPSVHWQWVGKTQDLTSKTIFPTNNFFRPLIGSLTLPPPGERTSTVGSTRRISLPATTVHCGTLCSIRSLVALLHLISGKSGFTDYVRRRRWARKCRIQTTGPWKQIGSTKIIDVSLHVS